MLQSRQFSSSSSPDTPPPFAVLSFQLQIAPRTTVVLASRQFSFYSSPNTRAHGTNRTLACISRNRARSPLRVAPEPDNSHSRLHFAHSTRTISAEGCAGTGQIALSPAFRALDTHDLRRGLRAQDKSRSRLHFAHSIFAEGCPQPGPIALSPAFRALDAHDLRRGLPACRTNRALACISRTRHARSPQRVARATDKSHFAHSTRTISAEGCNLG